MSRTGCMQAPQQANDPGATTRKAVWYRQAIIYSKPR
jgi:hypothetical protein